MKTKSFVKTEYEVNASRESFEKTVEIISREVSIPTSKKDNATFDEKDLHRSLIELSISNGYAESLSESFAVNEPLLSGKVPSGSWIRKTIRKINEEEMVLKLQEALNSTVKQLASYKIFSAPIIAGVDTQKIKRYDLNADGGFLRRGKPERGTTTFEENMTLQCVEAGRRAQISCEHFALFDEKSEVLRKLILNAKALKIEIALLLMDRGFFDCKTINMLNRMHQLFLTPCIKNSGIKKAMMEYVEGKRECISEYTMGSGNDSCKFTLVILRKAGSEKETDPLKRYIAFATNIPKGDILWNINKLPKDYRMRWGLETGYIGVGQLRARTTSRNHSLRLLYFYYALILYNAWLLANLILASRLNVFHLIIKEPIIRLQLLKDVFHRMIVESILIEAYGIGASSRSEQKDAASRTITDHNPV
jgi:hypothetical protein